MKRKKNISKQDLKDWKSFIDNLKEVEDKEVKFSNQSKFEKKIQTIDLHGASLTEANKKIIEFIYNAYDNGFKKLKIITRIKYLTWFIVTHYAKACLLHARTTE